MKFQDLIEDRIRSVDAALNFYLPGENVYPQTIHRAIRYSVFAGGKRMRPLLALFTAELFNPDWKRVLPASCALELIHTYSLIHDDLPAMDNDDYRRGKPTSHKVFGEGTAILAGDALLTYAFKILAGHTFTENDFNYSYNHNVTSQLKLKVISDISRAAGLGGMISGQVVDMESECKQVDEATLDYINMYKTGALLAVSARAGAMLGGCSDEEAHIISVFGTYLGKGFQLVDDLLDVEGNEARIGKATGSDSKQGKATYISIYGSEKIRYLRDELYQKALESLEPIKNRNIGSSNLMNIRELARTILYRDH